MGNEVDRAPSTYYIKPVLRLFCIAALSLAALNSGFARPSRPFPRPPPPRRRGTTEALRRRRRLNEFQPLPAATATAPPAQEEMVTLQYPNSDVADVLHLYETADRQEAGHGQFRPGQGQHLHLTKPHPARRSDQDHRDEPAHERLLARAGGGRRRESDRHREKSAHAPVCRLFPTTPTSRPATTSSAFSSSCATPIRSRCNRCSASIFHRRRPSLRFWRCPKPRAFSSRKTPA